MSLFQPTKLISKHLDKVYQFTQRDIAPLSSAKSLAEEAKKHAEDLEGQIDWLIKREGYKSGASGFLGGVSGASLALFSLPANFASVTYLQMRLASAIAYLCGMDPEDKEVSAKICELVAGTTSEIPRGSAVQVGKSVAARLIKRLPKKALKKVNETAGKKLLFKGNSGDEALKAANNADTALKDAAKGLVKGDDAQSAAKSASKPTKKTRASKKEVKKADKLAQYAHKADQAQEPGLLDLTRFVPLIGGVVGGFLDAKSTNQLGNKVRQQFS